MEEFCCVYKAELQRALGPEQDGFVGYMVIFITSLKKQ
jgi:hypothetical protein